MSDILTYDEYTAIENVGFSQPYIVEVVGKDKQLLFYGSEHSSDLNHPQFKDIESKWKKFIASARHPIALVEGRYDEVSEEDTTDKKVVIKEGGEALFLVYLARRDGVELLSPEPERRWEANKLAKEFGRENVVFYYIVRQLTWWSTIKEKNVKMQTETMLDLMKSAFGWDEDIFTVRHLNKLHQDIFEKPFVWDDKKWLYGLTTPATTDSITNKLARRSGDLRDEYLIKKIKDYWHEDKSPFVVFGSSHAIRLEPALKKLR